MKAETKKIHFESTVLIKQIIADNIDSNISLGFISKKTHLSVFHLARIFKRQEGVSIKKYILSKKLEETLNDVIYTNRKLIDISFKKGFDDYTTFSRNFKTAYRVSPDDLRKIILLIKQQNNIPANATFCVRTGINTISGAANAKDINGSNAFIAKKSISGRKKQFLVHPYIMP